MNKQRKVVITTTYNEMGIIIDTKAEEVAQPDLQPTCNNLATDCISRAAAIDALRMDISIIPFAKAREYVRAAIETIYNRLEGLSPAQPERKTGHKINQHQYPAKWVCSECGARHFDFSDNFCSQCGADVTDKEGAQDGQT